VTKHTETLL